MESSLKLGDIPGVWGEADAHERKALLQHFVQGWGAAIYIYPGQRLEVLAAPRSDAEHAAN